MRSTCGTDQERAATNGTCTAGEWILCIIAVSDDASRRAMIHQIRTAVRSADSRGMEDREGAVDGSRGVAVAVEMRMVRIARSLHEADQPGIFFHRTRDRGWWRRWKFVWCVPVAVGPVARRFRGDGCVRVVRGRRLMIARIGDVVAAARECLLRRAKRHRREQHSRSPTANKS